MPVKFRCPNPACGVSAEVDDSRIGREVRCTRCGEKFALIPPTRATPIGATPDDLEPSAPTSFGRFRVIRELGRGGMGTVYLAEDSELGRLVAMKVPHPRYRDAPEVRERLLREARVAAQFRHPNFCPIHDIGEVDGVPYLRLSYIEGRTLASMIAPDRPWSRRKAAEVVRRLAVALAEAHRRGIIHRDLKPANVMVDLRGALVIMDFGLALRLDAGDPRITEPGAIVGTPAYMPPEQVEGNHGALGPWSDIYSLGVILYELLTSRRPFEGSSASILGQVIWAEPPSPSSVRAEIDPRLDAICLKAIAKRPDDRFASMGDFASALQGWIDSKKSTPESRIAWPPTDLSEPRLRLAPDSCSSRSKGNGLATGFLLASGLMALIGVATLPGSSVVPWPRIPLEPGPKEVPRPPTCKPNPPQASKAVPRQAPVSTPSAILEPIPPQKAGSVLEFEEVGPPPPEPKKAAANRPPKRKPKRQGPSSDPAVQPVTVPASGAGQTPFPPTDLPNPPRFP